MFNEKILAGLGRELAVTQRLSPDGVEAALAALRRFAALVAAAKPERVASPSPPRRRSARRKTVPAFCRRVRAETGLELEVLSGHEEARYAALGVLAGAPHSTGLVGDLGGASLELVRLDRDQPGDGVTLPLGPFSFKDIGRFDPDRVRSPGGAEAEAACCTFVGARVPCRGRRLAQSGAAGHANGRLPARNRPPVRTQPARGAGGGPRYRAAVAPIAREGRGDLQTPPGHPASRRRGAGRPDRDPWRRARCPISLRFARRRALRSDGEGGASRGSPHRGVRGSQPGARVSNPESSAPRSRPG